MQPQPEHANRLPLADFADGGETHFGGIDNGDAAAALDFNRFVGTDERCRVLIEADANRERIVGEGGERQLLGQLKAGDTFGELSLMTGDAMLADFIAESRCEVMLIPVSLFQSVIVAEPRAVQHISRTIAERMKMVMADPAKSAAAIRKGQDPYGLQLKGERPEKILVINCGSSSLKYSFYDTADESRSAHGQVERIGIDGTRLETTRDLQRVVSSTPVGKKVRVVLMREGRETRKVAP